jgi:hypothetical protein
VLYQRSCPDSEQHGRNDAGFHREIANKKSLFKNRQMASSFVGVRSTRIG